jgi:hypothetical protein
VRDRDTTHTPGFPPLTNGGAVDLKAEHQHALKFPLMLRRGFAFVLIGFATAAALLFYTPLFCLTGAKSAIIKTFRTFRTFVAR